MYYVQNSHVGIRSGAAHQTAGAQRKESSPWRRTKKTIYVYENWRGEAPTLLGRLRCGFVRGQETFSFEYDPAWLSSAESSFSLDPDLALYRGRQYVPLNKQLFGLFSDSCPDRWGRLLMKRKEAIDARKEDRKAP